MQIDAGHVLLMVITSLVGSGVQAEGLIYKCKSQEGSLIYQKAPCNDKAETVTSWENKQKPEAPVPETATEASQPDNSPVLTLKQNQGGHYATDGVVDGKGLNFIIDTGASYVSLPEAIAHSALIYCDTKKTMNTANGKTDACTAKIKKLMFGPFVLNDVFAIIVPNLDQPLLGMNVLGLFKITQDKAEMKLSVLEKEKPSKTKSEK